MAAPALTQGIDLVPVTFASSSPILLQFSALPHLFLWAAQALAVSRILVQLARTVACGVRMKSRSAAVKCLGLDLLTTAWKSSLFALSENS